LQEGRASDASAKKSEGRPAAACDSLLAPRAKKSEGRPAAACDSLLALNPPLFSDYLSGNGWVRAVSLNDASMADVECEPAECSTLAKVSMRPDVSNEGGGEAVNVQPPLTLSKTQWTATGAYGGLLGAAVDALGDLEGGLSDALRALESAAVVAHPEKGTMPAQGIAVMSTPMFRSALGEGEESDPEHAFAPNFPEFFDDAEVAGGFPSQWPSTSRSIQNAEGSIVDAFVRTVFGWRPGWAEVLEGAGGGGGGTGGRWWRGASG
jgi:hypothetical protein